MPWITKKIRLIFISVEQVTAGLQGDSSRKLCGIFHIFKSRIIPVYKNPVYLIVVIEDLKKEN
ncbi:hypothetical protein V7420_27775 [Bacillus toyonensis]|nr:hypothetical protein [Bacillus toyonensis]